MSASCIPTIGKSGIVVPIFKKGSTSDVSNYRSITLTCITCKIMEAIIKDDIISHLWKHKLILKHQHGFLTQHSTSTQLLECANDWSISLSNKKQCCLSGFR